MKIRRIQHFTLTFIVSVLCLQQFGQTIEIEAQKAEQELLEGHLTMGNPGLEGKEILINNKYLTIGGKPILPIMGEVHFSRINKERWEDVILKMKANGINIIAFYIFWNHHEEIEGEFDWSGNKDVRAFGQLCKKHNVWAYPRLGPWSHGEVRNGGFPDWLLQKNNIKLRSNDSAYQQYAERFYKEISQQLKGLYYKDGGPIIGVQIENEYWRGKGGEAHISWLKNTAKKYGVDVPLYTVTGWRNASVPAKEVIPLWGGYPAAPWNTNLKKIEHNESYLFKKPINDQSIGHKENSESYRPDYSIYPYLTCELGIGNQISEHRRPIIGSIDGMAIAMSHIASGSNLLGYYVFAGGLNPVGKLTTLEEDRWESGYWNEYPDISYDFQAAIKETGEIAPAYHKLKPLHYFLNEFGNLLAPMHPVLPQNNEDWDDLQYSFRTNGTQGFLFVSNYYRGHTKTTKKKVQFNIRLKGGEVKLPSKPVEIRDSAVFFWPVNFKLNNALLKYASIQPICKVSHGDTTDWYFKETQGISPELMISTPPTTRIFYQDKEYKSTNNNVFLKDVSTGLKEPVLLESSTGQIQRLFVLTERQSSQFWHFKEGGKEYAYISTANLINKGGKQLEAFSTNRVDTLVVLNGSLTLPNEKRMSASNWGSFETIQFNYNNGPVNCKLDRCDIIGKAQWLNLQASHYSSSKELYSKQFVKKTTLENTAKIKNVTMHLYSGLACKIRVNKHWVNQKLPIKTNTAVDLTGYFQKGENTVLMNFPYQSNEEAFIAVIEIEYYNADKEYMATDSTWQTTEQYKIPAPWEMIKNLATSTVIKRPKDYPVVQFSPNRYSLSFNMDDLKKYPNAYLRINYFGDKAQCRVGRKLIADNFNNGTTWSINLSDFKNDKNKPLIFELSPWSDPKKVYFENEMEVSPAKTGVETIHVTIENHAFFYIEQ